MLGLTMWLGSVSRRAMLYWVRLPQYWAFQPDQVLSGAMLGCAMTGYHWHGPIESERSK